MHVAVPVLSMAPAQALTTQECSAKYQAAKTAGTLNGQKWNDFRKAQCGSDAAAATATAPATAEAKPKKPEAAPAAAPAPVGRAVFPSAVDSKYSKETAGRGPHAYLRQSVQRQQGH
jgi:hypothetical protein